MRKIITLILLLSGLLAHATVHTVTSTSDDRDNPTAGMLRYYVLNSMSGDTIRFAVDRVDLQAQISISYKALTIDGGEGVILDGGGTSRVFNISANAFSRVHLSGLTIQNGYYQDDNFGFGGGMYVFATSAEAVIVRDCVFRNNVVYSINDAQGGGVRSQGGTFINCHFLNNQTTGTKNTVGGGGAAVTGGVLINCVFAGNSAKYGGGLLAAESTITNCTFTQNTTLNANNGGGVNGENLLIVNSIIYNNKSDGMENNVSLIGSNISYSALEHGNALAGINNNIGLIETPFIHAGKDSLSLKEGSVCIDAGNSGVSNLPDTDIRGFNRIMGAAVDMGAYETYQAVKISGIVKLENGTLLANYSLSEGLVTDGDATYTIIPGENGFETGQTVTLNAPEGYEFYPRRIVIGEVSQIINLTAYKGIVVDNNDLTESTITWNADTVNVFSDLFLDNINLIVNPGTKVKFRGYYGIRVSGTGTINAIGTATEPIIFTSADTTGISTFGPSNIKGAWNRMVFDNMSQDADSSSFKFCTFSYSIGLSEYGTDGAAIMITSYDKILFSHCHFSFNGARTTKGASSGMAGGAMRIISSSISIINCIFNDNHFITHTWSSWGGGAIYFHSGHLNIVNCTFVNNRAPRSSGGAIFLGQSATANIYNSIFYENIDRYGKNSFAGHVFNLYNSNVQGGNTFKANTYRDCYDFDPEFTDAASGDFSLSSQSMLINTGNLTLVSSFIDTVDIFGNNRVHQGQIDIGAAEYQHDVSLTFTGMLTMENGEIIPGYEIVAGVFTDAEGKFEIHDAQEYFEGGVVKINNFPDHEIYPSRLGWNKPRNVDLVAYKGIVVDNSGLTENTATWDAYAVNVFSDLILDDINLNIKPGTKVRFHGYFGIRVSGTGTINAVGTASKPITFTSADTTGISNFSDKYRVGAWNKIVFDKMSVDADSSVFKFCTFSYSFGLSNHGTDGSAIMISSYNKVLFSHCLFSGNKVIMTMGYAGTSGGGAIRVVDSSLTLSNSVFVDNTVEYIYDFTGGGGAINAHNNSYVNIVNCNFIRNGATRASGGAIFYSGGSTFNIYNSVFYENFDRNGTNSFSKSKVFHLHSSLNLYNCNVQGGKPFIADTYEHCNDTDPQFADILSGNFSLTPESPLINAGNLAYASSLSDATDFYGNARVHQGLIDIGAVEFQNDISLVFHGVLKKENGDIVPAFEITPNVFTDDDGNFAIHVVQDYALGDTIKVNNPVGYEVYPSHLVMDWDRLRRINPVAYSGKVVDEFSKFDQDVLWESGLINVFTDIKVDQYSLYIEKGSLIRFHENSGLFFSGSGVLIAEGTVNDSIVFTTAYHDKVNHSLDNYAHAWKGINFHDALPVTPMSLLQYCKIEYAIKRENAAGGGISINNFSPVRIQNSKISNNRGHWGGGIYINNSQVEIINSQISFNIEPHGSGITSDIRAGGVYVTQSNPTIIGCVINNNISHFSGGGLVMYYASPIIIGSTIVNNSRGGIHLFRSSPRIYNSILSGTNDFQLTAFSVDSYSRNVKVYNSCIKGGNHISANTYQDCIDEDPLFMDAAIFDYSLQSESPCINQGTNDLPVSMPDTDIAGNVRKMGKFLDIGAYEYPEVTITVKATYAVVNFPVKFTTDVHLGTIDSWSWDFTGNGEEDSDINNPLFTYSETGIFQVRLIANIVELGVKDTVYIQVEVFDPVIADFSANVTSSSPQFEVYFSDLSANNPGFWLWDFGDGNTSTLKNPIHKYDTCGIFSVTLIAGNETVADTIIKTEYIEMIDGYLMKTGFYTTDSGYFYDDMGYYKSYTPNVSYTLTFYPATDKKALKFNFENIQLCSPDVIKVYNGISDSAPLIKEIYENKPQSIEATNADGAVTFVFSSSQCSSHFENAGWKARISTNNMFDVNLSSDSNGYLSGDSIQRIVEGRNSSSVTAVPAQGYLFSYWASAAGDSVTNANPLVITNITKDTTLVAVFRINTVSVNDMYVFNTRVYPNPVSENLTIDAENLRRIEIADIKGRIIYSAYVTEKRVNINMQNYESGLYILHLYSQDQKQAVKIIKN